MTWKIKIHPEVKDEDFKKIDKSQQKRIIKAIKNKLGRAPLKFGKKLKGKSKEFRRLKAGDYRVIYEVKKEKVLVLVIKVGIRRDAEVYKEFFNRIKKIKK